MGFKIPGRNWIKLKSENYKEATSQHYDRLSDELEKDAEDRMRQILNRSITVLIDLSSVDQIAGIDVDRSCVSTKVGERVSLIRLDNRETISGRVAAIHNEQVRVKLDNPLKANDNSKQDKLKFRLKFDQAPELERKRRIRQALKKFRKISCSLPLHRSLLGDYSDRTNVRYAKARLIHMKGLIELKGNQLVAVDQSMRKRLSMVEGSAGSGKTVIAAHIACSASRLRLAKIIVCSTVQSTVDRIAEMIASTGSFSVIRLGPECSDKRDPGSQSSTSLEEATNRALYERARRRYLASFDKQHQKVDQVAIHKQASRMARQCSPWLRKKLEHKLLRKADVVCCTAIQAGSPILRGIKFDMLIIDDAQVASTLDCMVPLMVRGIKQVTLLGDVRRDILTSRSKSSLNNRSKRNDPFEAISPRKEAKVKSVSKSSRISNFKSRIANKIGVEEKLVTNLGEQARRPGSLFERWLSFGLSTVALKYQFRMHRHLVVFPNHYFYLSRLKTDITTNECLAKQVDGDFSWLPKRECSTALFDVSSSETNLDRQYKIVKLLVDKLVLREKIDKSRICVLTNNRENCRKLDCNLDDDVECITVNDCVGQERDYVILTAFQDTNSEQTKADNFDYMRNETALNMALTRARLGFFVVADCNHLSGMIDEAVSSDKQEQTDVKRCFWAWQSLINYYRTKNLTAENLKLDQDASET